MRTPTWAVTGLFVLLVAYVVWASFFWFVTDDAFITFRYSRMWAEGYGVRFNPGDHVPVEGYSNFLWMAIAALVCKVGLEPPVVMPALSLLTGVAFVVYVWRHTQDRFGFSPMVALITAAALALSPGMVVWATGGLATMPAAFLLYITFDRWVLSDEPGDVRVGGWAALLMALMRTEGIAWVAVVAVLAVMARWLEPDRRKVERGSVARAGMLLLGVYGAYYLWRFVHFETLVSNTAMAKVDFGVERVVRGGTYVVAYWLEALTPPLILLAGTAVAWPVARWRGLMVAAMAFGVPLYAVLVGGDFMAMGRLLVPGLAFQAVLLGFVLRDASWASRPVKAFALGAAVALIALGAQPLNNVQLVPKDVRQAFRVRFNTISFRTEFGQWSFMRANALGWSNLGKALNKATQPGESLVLGAIGAVAYYSDLFIYDRFGLVTREVTEREAKRTGGRHSPGHDMAVPNAFFLDDEPTYIWASNNQLRGLARIPREVGGFANARIREFYGPRVEHVVVEGEDFYVTLLQRMDDPQVAWDALDARVEALKLEAMGEASKARKPKKPKKPKKAPKEAPEDETDLPTE